MKKDLKTGYLTILGICLLTFLVFIQTISAASSQAVKLTLNMRDVSIQKVFEAIEAQSNFSFLVRSSDVDLNQKVSIEAKNQTVSETLDHILGAKNISYIIRDKHILVYTKGEAEPELRTQDQKGLKIIGSVSDDNGVLMPGVNVIVKGTTMGTTTDSKGEFTITVPGDTSVIQFRMIGYKMQEIIVGQRRIITVTLSEEVTDVGEVVVVGFGKQKKTDMVGSVTSISATELKKVSSSNITTMMAGNIAGIISYQRSGEPGADNADFFIRGVTTFGYKKDPLILIDGIEVSRTDLARMQPDDIENFSILKDATSTAVYGARGANGVIAITTKEGTEGKMKISVRGEYAVTSPTRMIETVDPVTYMRLANEAVTTRDPLQPTLYSNSKIDNTAAGKNPMVYPAVDWYDEMMTKTATVQRINMNASGGGKVARYYLAATFNQDNGNLKVPKQNDFNNNVRLRTYSLRSNVNFNLTKSTKAALKISGVFDDYNGPLNSGSDVYNQVMHANPALFPPYYRPDETYAYEKHILFGNYNASGASNPAYINPYAEMVKGYKEYSRSTIDAQFELQQDLSMLTKGLSVRALFNTSRYSYFDVSRYYNPYYYQVGFYNPETDTYFLNQMNEGTDYLGYTEGPKQVNASTYIEAMANYNRTFNDIHTVSGMLVYTMRNYLEGNAGSVQLSLPHRNLGLSGRATYSYKEKYFGEFNFGYNGSERFAAKHRFGFFPSIGAAWIISKEDFWHSNVISNLKLRVTYGLVGNDAIGSDADRFYYLSNVDMDWNNIVFGADGASYSRTGVLVTRNSNPEIGWEISRKLNVGVELGLNDKFTLEADYFSERRTNILMDRANIPTTMGLYATEKANVGEAKSRGVDGSLNYSVSFNHNWWLKVRANFTFATSEFLVYEEPQYDESYRQHLGHSLSQQWGLIAERLFIDDAEVANSPEQTFGPYMAGDLKYRDVNRDGKISPEDAVPIGYPTDPEIIYGFGASTGYHNFDFAFFFQGSARSSFWIDPRATSPFANETQMLQVYADSYWSEDRRDLYALWPRLSTSVIENNVQTNTWFMRDGAFLRLKSVEVGYTLPLKLVKKISLSNARFYLNGTNLLCFSKFKLWDIEMGGNGMDYPIQKSFNIGLTVGF